jgi:DNA-binding phage protein
MRRRAEPPGAKLAERLILNIRRHAKERRIVVTRLPHLAGVGHTHFFEVLAGRASPTLQWLAQVAKALGVDVHKLLKP